MKKTKDYEMFTLVDTNRDILVRHVTEIMDSIQKKNLLEHNPIIVDRNMVVIDGQHRLEAAKQLDVEIYYTVAEQVGIREIRKLNSSQKRWTLTNYVKSFAKTIDDYQFLWDFSKAHSLPLSVGALILSNFTETGRSKSVRDGEFRIGNMEQVNEVMTAIDKLKPFISDVARRDKVFNFTIEVLSRKKVDWDKMSRKANTVATAQDEQILITKQSTQKNYLRMFEDIYNYKAQIIQRLF